MSEPQPELRPLVLVADDDEDILQLLSFRIERAGYEIVQARNGTTRCGSRSSSSLRSPSST